MHCCNGAGAGARWSTISVPGAGNGSAACAGADRPMEFPYEYDVDTIVHAFTEAEKVTNGSGQATSNRDASSRFLSVSFNASRAVLQCGLAQCRHSLALARMNPSSTFLDAVSSSCCAVATYTSSRFRRAKTKSSANATCVDTSSSFRSFCKGVECSRNDRAFRHVEKNAHTSLTPWGLHSTCSKTVNSSSRARIATAPSARRSGTEQSLPLLAFMPPLLPTVALLITALLITRVVLHRHISLFCTPSFVSFFCVMGGS